jgi:hypothetical protein
LLTPPRIGDFIDCFLALMVVRMCSKVDGGLPQQLRARMIFNILLDFGIGLVPIIGDIADALYRANTRNAWLLEMYLVKKAEAQRRGVVEDPDTGKNVPVKALPAGTTMASQTTEDWHGSAPVARPRPAATTNRAESGVGSSSQGGGSGWRRFFGSSGNASAPVRDEEMSVGHAQNGYNGARNNIAHPIQQNGTNGARSKGGHPVQQSGITTR